MQWAVMPLNVKCVRFSAVVFFTLPLLDDVPSAAKDTLTTDGYVSNLSFCRVYEKVDTVKLGKALALVLFRLARNLSIRGSKSTLCVLPVATRIPNTVVLNHVVDMHTSEPFLWKGANHCSILIRASHAALCVSWHGTSPLGVIFVMTEARETCGDVVPLHGTLPFMRSSGHTPVSV